MAATTDTKMARLNIRATKHQKDVISRAARMAHTSVSEFVLHKAYENAQEVLAEQSHFRVSAKQWRQFCAALDAPPRDLPTLRKLLKKPSVFDE
jgi:uncharacterized protein (DUF1778 family)